MAVEESIVSDGSLLKRELRGPDPQYRKRIRQPVLLVFQILWIIIIILPSILYATLKLCFRRKKSVKGKVCIVTGSGRGLGRGIAVSLGRLGAKVVCVDVHEKNNAETVSLIQKSGGVAAGYTVNVAKREDVLELVADVQRQHGDVDVLVNNAGLVMGMPVHEWTHDEITASYNVNVLSHYWTISACLESMKKRNQGQIVTMSSMSGLVGCPYLTIYAATKAAITALSDSLREELDLKKDNKIKVTVIHPFFINTSADYLSYYDIRVPVLHEDEAIDSIMDAILYEEHSVSVPRDQYYLVHLIKLMPRNVQLLMLDIVDTKVTAPSRSTRQSLPYYDIVTASVQSTNDHKQTVGK